jgi:N-acetylglutamate synthase/N-acetylornithine aminotransferase
MSVIDIADAAERQWLSRQSEGHFRRITVDWDTSQADDFRTRGVSWSIK